jgi:hypothetical protein
VTRTTTNQISFETFDPIMPSSFSISHIVALVLIFTISLLWFFTKAQKGDQQLNAGKNGREHNQPHKTKRKGKRRRNKTKGKKSAKKSNSMQQALPQSYPFAMFNILLKFAGREIEPQTTFEDDDDEKMPSISFVAMDCEMVGIGRQGINSMLARCSLVTIIDDESKIDGENDEDFKPRINVLYDVYVKPTKHITDYRTEYSGITPEHLESDDAVNYEVCRSKIISLLKPTEDKIVVLVGHALKNDFEVLGYWVSQ